MGDTNLSDVVSGRVRMYGVTASIRKWDDPWESFRQVPTFYLHSHVQGILNTEHAKSIARVVLNLNRGELVEGKDYHLVVWEADI